MYRLTEIVKSIFGQSDYQIARKDWIRGHKSEILKMRDAKKVFECFFQLVVSKNQMQKENSAVNHSEMQSIIDKCQKKLPHLNVQALIS